MSASEPDLTDVALGYMNGTRLRRALAGLGIKNVFSPLLAQLSAIICPHDIDVQQPHVDAVQHTVSHRVDGLLVCARAKHMRLPVLSAVVSAASDSVSSTCCRVVVAQVSMKVNEDGAQAKAVTQAGIMVRSLS